MHTSNEGSHFRHWWAFSWNFSCVSSAYESTERPWWVTISITSAVHKRNRIEPVHCPAARCIAAQTCWLFPIQRYHLHPSVQKRLGSLKDLPRKTESLLETLDENVMVDCVESGGRLEGRETSCLCCQVHGVCLIQFWILLFQLSDGAYTHTVFLEADCFSSRKVVIWWQISFSKILEINGSISLQIPSCVLIA